MYTGTSLPVAHNYFFGMFVIWDVRTISIVMNLQWFARDLIIDMQSVIITSNHIKA